MRAVLPLALAACLCGCEIDHRQARLCAAALLEVEGIAAQTARREALAGDHRGIALALPDGRRFECRFAGGAFEPGQSRLLSVRRLDGTQMPPFAFAHLRSQLGLPP